MHIERALTVGLAVCLLFALGASANALDGASSTDPDEAVDVDYSDVPISEAEAGAVRDAAIEDTDEEAPSPEKPESASELERGGEGPHPDGLGESSGDDGDEQRLVPGDGQSFAVGSEGSDEDDRSLFDRLLALLERLLPLVALPAVLALAYALRRRLRSPSHDAADGEERAPETAAADPEDPVSEAWYAMVRDLGLDDDVAKTPRECERAAEAAGVDSGAVHTLTALFERTRYAGEPVTPERSREARERLAEFRRDYGGVDAT